MKNMTPHRGSLILRILRLLGHSDWIRFGIRFRIISLFCSPYTPKDIEFEVDFFGSRYRGNLGTYLEWMVYFFGAYEKSELLLLRELVENSSEAIFLDVGANVGQHSLFMSRYCRQVHSFEPYPAVRKKLEMKIRLNKIENITVHPVGLGERDEALPYFAPQGSNTGTGSFLDQVDGNQQVPTSRLQIVHGDRLVEKLHLQELHLIKIDVQGFERFVLSGLHNTILKYRPAIYMEFSEETRDSFTSYEEFIASFPEDYRFHHVKTNRKFLFFFNRAFRQLSDFKFVPGDILCMPIEKSSLIQAPR